MEKKSQDPLRGPGGVVLKFMAAALFGCLMSLLLLLMSVWTNPEGFWNGWWPHLLRSIPLAWGVMGIFWFDRMLELAKVVFEGVAKGRD